MHVAALSFSWSSVQPGFLALGAAGSAPLFRFFHVESIEFSIYSFRTNLDQDTHALALSHDVSTNVLTAKLRRGLQLVSNGNIDEGLPLIHFSAKSKIFFAFRLSTVTRTDTDSR